MLIGNLGRDPELKQTGNSVSVAKLSLATNERKKEGGEWKDHTEWHSVVVWDKDAEFVAKYAKKGDALYLEGRVRTRKYEKAGETRYITEVVANPGSIILLTSPGEEEAAKPEDDDIPF
jgi:single-strand DNA-binding protein